MDIIETSQKKYYSLKSISIATYLGAPLVAGYLASENYKSVNEPDKAKSALILGVVSTVCLFVILWNVPEHILDHIPNAVVPTIYTGIVYVILKATQGEMLDEHEANKLPFYSSWRAAGLGLVSGLIILGGIFGMVYFSDDAAAYDTYIEEMETFSANEDESFIFYDLLDTETDAELLKHLKHSSIPKWEENIKIVNQTNNIKDLPDELKERNVLLVKYCNLRIEVFQYMQRGIEENTDIYDKEIELSHTKIDLLLDELNQM